MSELRDQIDALDLFAGTGWGVAAKRIGIRDNGVEIMKEAVASRALNGLETIYRDVWTGLGNHRSEQMRFYELLIASPPCPTFSRAGNGEGRAAMPLLEQLVAAGVYQDAESLEALTHVHGIDPRTALILTPLAYAWRDRPRYIALEQVPTVQPLWDIYADVLLSMGYTVDTGVLHAEQWGVPQTRRRSILVARLDGKQAKLPTPTHSKYYVRKPAQLDAGLQKWVSMAEALGWGMTKRPSMTLTGGGLATGGYEAFSNGSRQGMDQAAEAGNWVLRSNYGTHGDPENRGERGLDQPAPTVTSKVNRNKWTFAGAGATARKTSGQRPREMDEPAHTLTGKETAVWLTPGLFTDGPTPAREVDHQDTTDWVFDAPAPTIVGSFSPDIVAARRHREPDEHRQDSPGSVRITVDEAKVLQSYPADFQFAGSKSKQFLQIGNAVPPLMAEAILRELIS